MSDDEISVMQMDVRCQRSEEQSGEAAHDEQPDEAECVEHRRVKVDVSLVQRAQPVEHLDRGWHSNEEAQQRERDAGIGRLARDEHVMAPDEEADHGNRDTGPGYELVAEQL